MKASVSCIMIVIYLMNATVTAPPSLEVGDQYSIEVSECMQNCQSGTKKRSYSSKGLLELTDLVNNPFTDTVHLRNVLYQQSAELMKSKNLVYKMSTQLTELKNRYDKLQTENFSLIKDNDNLLHIIGVLYDISVDLNAELYSTSSTITVKS